MATEKIYDFRGRQSGNATKYCIGLIHKAMDDIDEWQVLSTSTYQNHQRKKYIISRCRFLVDKLEFQGFHFKRTAIMYNGKKSQ